MNPVFPSQTLGKLVHSTLLQFIWLYENYD